MTACFIVSWNFIPDPKGSLQDFQLLQHTEYQVGSLVRAIEIWPIWRERAISV